jgi:hypothetical protein
MSVASGTANLSIKENKKKMYSRRGFLIRLLMCTPLILTPIQLLNRTQAKDKTRSGKLMKQGWMLQEGDI